MSKSEIIRSFLKIAAIGLIGTFAVFLLQIFVPIFETDKDQPGVYRISTNGGHEVVYLSHLYALHRMGGETFVAPTYYAGTYWPFSTGDVPESPKLGDVVSVEQIRNLDGFVISTGDNPFSQSNTAGVLTSEKIELFPSRESAVESLEAEGTEIEGTVFNETDLNSLSTTSLRVDPYEAGRKAMRVTIIVILLVFVILSMLMLYPIFRNAPREPVPPLEDDD